MRGDDVEFDEIFRGVLQAREEAWLGDAQIQVVHGNGCQKTMRNSGGGLSMGATRYMGIFVCDDCDEAVIIRIRAPPDVPFQLYKQEGEVEV